MDISKAQLNTLVNAAQAGRTLNNVAHDATVPKAAIRAPHLQRIVMHLVANAIEYLRDQEERWLKVEGVFNEDVITLTILNSGSVIDAAAAEHLFEPLVSTKGNAYAGMGLATARTLAQEAGGDLVYCASTGFELSVPVAP